MPLTTTRLVQPVALVVALASGLTLACGGSPDGSEVENGSAGGSSAHGSGTGVGAQPDLAPVLSSGTGGGASNGGVEVITPGSECAQSSGRADAVPAVVQMVVDISGSMEWAPGTMAEPRGNAQSKWAITAEALKGAVAKLPGSIAVGLNFYPNNPSRRECIRNRVDLPIALLGDATSRQRVSFDNAIDDAVPGGGTPTHAAYNFGLKTLQASPLEGRKFILLITDGVPTFTLQCEGAEPEPGQSPVDSAPLVAAVEAAYDGGAGASTFVIGSPGSEDARGVLSEMARKGGTPAPGCSDQGPTFCHLDMTSSTDFAEALSAGLAQVAGQLSTCEYVIPPGPAGKTLDPRKVNVLYTHGDGKESSIGKGDANDCQSGWRYDSEDAPTKIILCGSDCEGVKADAGAAIDVIFGCASQPTGVK